VCDLDGTLVDSAADIVAAERHAGVSVGLGELATTWLHERLGAPLHELLAEALGHSPDKVLLQRFVTSFRAHYYGAGYPGTQVLPGVERTLAALAPHCLLAVATTKPTRAANALLGHCGLLEAFDHVQGTDEGIPHKPDPAILRIVLNRYRCAPADAAMVGDTGRDIEAGRAAGMHTVAFAWQGHGRPGLRSAAPDSWVEGFDELGPLLAGLWGFWGGQAAGEERG